MAITHWIGDAMADKEAYAWKADVVWQLEGRTEREQFANCFDRMKKDYKLIADIVENNLVIQTESGWLRISRDGVIEWGVSARLRDDQRGRIRPR